MNRKVDNTTRRAWATALMLLAVLAAPASAVDIAWTGAEDADWFNPNNWSPIGAPAPEDRMSIAAGGPCEAARRITLDFGGQLDVDAVVSLDSLIAGYRDVGSIDIDTSAAPARFGSILLGELSGSQGTVAWRGADPAGEDADIEGLLTVGASGFGSFTLNAGVFRARAAVVGQFFGSEGVVAMSDCSADTFVCDEDLTVGGYGVGSMNAAGCVQSKAGILGFGDGGVGTVTIPAGGVWTVDDLFVVGHSGAGTLSVTGGSLTTGSAIIGGKGELTAAGTGEVSLTDSDWTNEGALFIGESGAGMLTAASGSTVACGDAYLGYEAAATGTATFSENSHFTCQNLFVGAYGQGTVSIAGGPLCVAGRAYLGWQPGGEGRCVVGAAGMFEVGDLFVGGDVVECQLSKDGEFGLHRRTGVLELASADSEVVVIGRLCLGAGGSVVAAGGRIVMDGASLVNESTKSAALADLANVEMTFTGACDAAATIEAAGEDRGVDVKLGQWLFPLGTVTVGGSGPTTVQLVDEIDNHPNAGGAEAVYVKNIVLKEGATLDLNGLNLYYETLVDEGGDVVGDGYFVEIGTHLPVLGDANGDGVVGRVDFWILKENFGSTDPSCPECDFNEDGVVDILDFIILKNNFGRTAWDE